MYTGRKSRCQSMCGWEDICELRHRGEEDIGREPVPKASVRHVVVGDVGERGRRALARQQGVLQGRQRQQDDSMPWSMNTF